MTLLKSISPDGSTIVQPGWSNQSYVTNMESGLIAVPAMRPVATTGASGFALQNGTSTILSWTAPNDGALHRVQVASILHVATLEVGGSVTLDWVGPFVGALVHTSTLFAAGLAADTTGQYPSLQNFYIVGPGTTFHISQATALTSGAATLWAEIWAS